MLVLPIIVSPSWWMALVGFFVMHFIAGFVLAIVFQCAHVVENADYPKPKDGGNMEHNWFAHQLHTTSNFASNSRLFSWFVGGLNFQVEHHLFPNIVMSTTIKLVQLSRKLQKNLACHIIHSELFLMR